MQSPRKVTLAIMIDAFRHDFLGKDTPFLLSLADIGLTGVIEPPLSFALPPTWFAGLYPETSNKFTAYEYSPEGSPHNLLSPIYSLESVGPFQIAARFIMHHLYPYTSGVAWHIPTHICKYFDFTEKFPPWNPQYLPDHTTLFDLLRERDLRWLFIGSPGSNQRTSSILNKFKNLISKQYSFIWLHFAELDWACHTNGPLSPQSKEKLREIDEAIEKIYTYLRNTYSSVNILVFGDHGQVEVKKRINIKKILNQSSLKIAEDYTYFLDSTIARFWFKNEQVEGKIKDILSRIKNGKILTQNDLTELRCNFKSTKYGQLLWVVDAGSLILPNFWQGRMPVKGMHGYHPDIINNHSCFIISSSNVDVEREGENKLYKSVDIFPTILKLMKLSIPDRNEGKSIIK